jgi:hypothetical protein
MNVDIWQRWAVGTVTTRGVVAQMLTSDMGLGRVKTLSKGVDPGSQEALISQAAIAAISVLIPTIFMTRVRL